MSKRKSIMLHVRRDNEDVLVTPVGSPEVVVGLLSSLVVPSNENLSLLIELEELEVPDAEKSAT